MPNGPTVQARDTNLLKGPSPDRYTNRIPLALTHDVTQLAKQVTRSAKSCNGNTPTESSLWSDGVTYFKALPSYRWSIAVRVLSTGIPNSTVRVYNMLSAAITAQLITLACHLVLLCSRSIQARSLDQPPVVIDKVTTTTKKFRIT